MQDRSQEIFERMDAGKQKVVVSVRVELEVPWAVDEESDVTLERLVEMSIDQVASKLDDAGLSSTRR